jgi:acyl carrier protein
MGEDTFERLQSIIINNLEIQPSEVTLSSSFIDDLQVDSLDIMDLVIALENAFDVTIPDSALDAFVTIKDVADYIGQRRDLPRPDIPVSQSLP